MGETDVVVKGNTINMTLDGTVVKIGEEVVMPCALTKLDLFVEVTVCKNMLFLIVRVALLCKRYVFYNLASNFVF